MLFYFCQSFCCFYGWHGAADNLTAGGCFIYLLFRLYIIAQTAEDLFGRLLVIGVFSHVALQAVLNLMVVTRLFPTPSSISRNTAAVPPELKKGRVTPVVGKSLVTTIRFSTACKFLPFSASAQRLKR